VKDVSGHITVDLFFAVMDMFATRDPHCSWIALYRAFVFVGNVYSFYFCAYSDKLAELTA
jgi:hypothetical protein